MSALADFMRELEKEFPRFRIVDKRRSALCKAIDVALKIITVGGQSEFMTRYHTVIGDTLYVPPGWERAGEIERVITLRHERVHLRQRRRYTMAGMTFLYLVPILPLGLALGRARLEWEAYTETIVATFELKGKPAAFNPALRRHIVGQFTGPGYGWMWPFPRTVDRWYDEVLAALDVRPT